MTLSRRFLSLLALVALLQCADGMFSASRAEEAASDSASEASKHKVREEFARQYAQTVLAVLYDSKESYADRKSLLRRSFSDSVDIDWMARFALGRGWFNATPEQREQYTALYRRYLTETYVSNFAEDKSQRIHDIKVLSVNDSEDDNFTVRTNMILVNFDVLKVSYLVNENAGHYKIRDIVIENVSLLETHRNEFSHLAASMGVDSVIAKLEHMLEHEPLTTAISMN